MADQGVPTGLSFRPVRSKPVNVQRDPQGITLLKSGWSRCNVAGTELFDGTAAELGLGVDTYAVRFGVHEELEQVAVYLVPPGSDLAVGVRRSSKSRQISFSLSGVFDECPKLQPASKRSCAIARSTDAAGTPIIMISLQTSLAKRKRATTNKSSNGEAQNNQK